jgi:thiol-disulfide isomerase/thioredoxin
MSSSRARRLRLPGSFAGSFAVAFLVAALVAGCGWLGRELQPGSYRAVLELPGGELPFGLDVAREESGLVLYLFNGAERVRVSDVSVADGELTATMPGYMNTLSARVRGRRLAGEVSLVRPGGERQVLPFAAELGPTWRFFAEPLTDNADVAGRWAVTFTGDDGTTSGGVAEFAQSFERVTGTILTPTGDHRFLAGEVHGDELRLSRFDGASALLYHARIDADGRLAGEYWSGRTGHRRFTAERNADATVDARSVLTQMQDPAARLAFSFPDPDGQLVSLADPQFAGKVVIVTLAGSWCPNCHDEAAFLAALHRQYRDAGLEVVSLMFEHFGDFAQAAEATRRFRAKFGIEYATLIAGTSDRDDAARALPQLNGVFAYPTTLWVDRSGQVRRIHAGFAGPATGQHHERLVEEFTAFTRELLAEGAVPPVEPTAAAAAAAPAAAP